MNYAVFLTFRDVEVFDHQSQEWITYVKNDIRLLTTNLNPGICEWPRENPIGILYVVPGNLIKSIAFNLLSTKQIANIIIDYWKKR